MQKIKYFLFILIAAFGCGALMVVHEWYQLRYQILELLELKEDYQEYIELLRKKLPAEYVAEDSCVLPLDQFIVLNRDISYLKDSAISYAQALDLFDNKTMDELYQSYEENPYPEKLVSQTKRVARKPQARSRATHMPEQDGMRGSMLWPLDKGTFRISSPFGPRKREDGSPGFHTGLDLAAPKGTRVKVVASGVVVEAGYAPGFGNTIVVAHNRKYKTRYAHLSKINVSKGQKVERGQVIGAVGNTGHVRGENGFHLHFEVYVFGKRVNPRQFLP